MSGSIRQCEGWTPPFGPTTALKAAASEMAAKRTGSVTVQGGFDVIEGRKALDRGPQPLPKGVRASIGKVAGVSGYWIEPGTIKQGCTGLFLHGGGYCAGDWSSYGHVALWFAHFLQARVFFPEYRLAPEHVFPAAYDDCCAVAAELLGQSSVVFAGDSAGAALCMSAAHHQFRSGNALPAAIALMCPMLDFSSRTSPYLQSSLRAREMSALYVSSQDPGDERISPLHGDLGWLPPLFVQTGSADHLITDSCRLVERLIEFDRPVTLEIWPDAPHVFHRFVPLAPEATAAIANAACFLNSQVTGADTQ